MDNMYILKNLDSEINILKGRLDKLIVSHDYNILDPEIIELSRSLDYLLLEHLRKAKIKPCSI